MSTIAVLTSAESGANSLIDINNNFSSLNVGKLEITNFIYNEVPSGAINGTNKSFTLANTPVTGSVRVWVDGIRFNASDFTVSSTTLTLTVAPQTELVVDYNK